MQIVFFVICFGGLNAADRGISRNVIVSNTKD
jgi:hypothetical protein